MPHRIARGKEKGAVIDPLGRHHYDAPMKRTLILLSLVFSLGAACHNGPTGTGDLAMPPPDLAVPLSSCGHPGDKGNSLGVGKFCTTIGDCTGPGLQTNICSSLGNGRTPSPGDTYFCTIYPCKPDGGAAFCGENAACVCGSGGGMSGCACTPTSCLGGPAADGGAGDM